MNRTVKILAAAMTLLLLLCMSTAAMADVVFAFEKFSYEVNVDKTLKLTPILQGAEAPKGAKYVWSTSDKSIATVSSGTVKGKAGGTATITCQMQDSKKNVLYETSCEVTVFQPVKKITMNPNKAIVMITSPKNGPAYTYQLEANVSPETASNKTLRYTSLTPELVTVSSDGLVKTTSKDWGGMGSILIETTDGSNLSKIQNIVIRPFIITEKEVVMEERGVYRLRIPVSVNKNSSSIFFEDKVPHIDPKNSGSWTEDRTEYHCSGYRMENIIVHEIINYITPSQVSDTKSAYCWFDIRPMKAGTYTIELESSEYGLWDKASACSYTFKIKVKESAAYSKKTFPELKYKNAMQSPDDMTGQQVYVEGRFIESWRDEQRWHYLIATGKGESDQVIIRAPIGQTRLDFLKADKLTVYGAFAQPMEEKTETGLTLYKLVIDAEMINGLCYNTDVYEVEMYNPAEINKKK